MHHPTDRIAHTTAFVTPVVEHWLEWEIAQWVHPMKYWSNDPSHHEWTRKRKDLPPLLQYTTLFNKQQGVFYMHHPTDRIIQTIVFCYTSCETLTGTQNSSMGPPWKTELTNIGCYSIYMNRIVSMVERKILWDQVLEIITICNFNLKSSVDQMWRKYC